MIGHVIIIALVLVLFDLVRCWLPLLTPQDHRNLPFWCSVLGGAPSAPFFWRYFILGGTNATQKLPRCRGRTPTTPSPWWYWASCSILERRRVISWNSSTWVPCLEGWNGDKTGRPGSVDLQNWAFWFIYPFWSILLVGKNFGRALLCRFVLVKHFRSNLA